MPESTESKEVLSTSAYWDSVLSTAKLPRINRYKDYYVTMRYVDSVLALESKKTFMEVGAGSSGWLPYFAQHYGYTVSGLDYSEVGCKIAEENLKMLGINYDEMLCEDIFKWGGNKSYDVIFSYGVVEHFEQPERLLKIMHQHLNPNGIIITLVPNLCGTMGNWSKRFVPEIYKIHKIIDRAQLLQMHQNVGFQPIKVDYVGMFSINVIPWIRSEHFLFRENSFQRKVSLFIISVISRVFSILERVLRISFPSRRFSPYVIAIMRKA